MKDDFFKAATFVQMALLGALAETHPDQAQLREVFLRFSETFASGLEQSRAPAEFVDLVRRLASQFSKFDRSGFPLH